MVIRFSDKFLHYILITSNGPQPVIDAVINESIESFFDRWGELFNDLLCRDRRAYTICKKMNKFDRWRRIFFKQNAFNGLNILKFTIH